MTAGFEKWKYALTKLNGRHCLEPAIHRHLAFCDYLRAHPDEAKHYGDVKAEVAKRFPYDSGGYVKGKDSLAKALEQKALVWKYYQNEQ